MLDISKLHRSTKTTSALTITATRMSIAPSLIPTFTPVSGGYYYALLEHGVNREIVRVTGHVSGVGLIIERAQDGTQAQAFPTGVCISIEWTPQQLLDFLNGRQNIAPVIEAGTYCLTCNSCLRINSDGTIAEVIGSEPAC